MAHQLQVTGSASFAFMGGSGNVITGADNLGDLFKITIGSNLTLSGGVLSATGGGTGSVTSVGLTTSATALTITNSPITTSGNIGLNFAGNSTQYVRGDGTLATFPTTNQASKLITEVYNETGATLTKGTVVYINGGHGNLPTVTKAKANSDATSAQTYGVVQADITNNNNGNVVVIGSLIDLDTQAYTDGTQLYLSGTTAGAWTDVKPQAPIHLVYVGIVTRSHPTQGVVEVKIQNGYELEELHDVKIVDVANNDGIFYNSSSSLWENKTISEVLGYTPANDANVVKLTGNQTVGGVKTFSSESIFSNGISLTGGDLVLKSGDFNTTINTDTLTESRSILFPDNSGTVALLTDIDYPVTSVFGRTGDVVAESGDYDTDMVDEGTTNLYYTNARARAALSVNTGSALGYNNTTGKFTLNAAESGVDGYLTGADWDAFDAKQNSLGTGTTSQFLRGDLVWAAPPTPALEDLTDVGITSPTNGQLLRYQVGTWVNWTPNYVSSTYFSATAPLSYNSGTGVFSISQATTSTNGYLSSTDWNTFNNKQNALTNPVTGTGASGYIAKWNTASTITNSLIYEASSKVGINTTNMVSLFDVTKNALGVTVVDTSGITLKNETEAITGNQQISPALHFKSNGWNNLASASQSADWINYSLPIQGNAVTSNLLWASSINGASYTTRFTLSSAGNGTFTGTLAASNLSGTNTGDVTIGTANGLSLSGQAISLALASTSTTGALSSTDWNTFNGKQAQINGTGFVKASGTTITYDNTSYLPLTGGTMSGGFSITNANSTYSIPSSTDVPNIYIFNSNSSSTTAHSILTLRTNLGGGGNPFISWDISGVTGYSMGIDNADSDKLKIAATWSNVASSTILTFTTAGAATFASNVSATYYTSNVTNYYGLIMNRPATTNFIGLQYQTSTTNQWFVGLRENGTNNYIIYNETTATDAFTINKTTNNTTFSNAVTATNLYLGSLTNEQLMISGTGSRGVGVSTTTSGDPYFRLYDNTTIKADMWWGRSGGYMGINSLGSGSITAINPFGGNVAIGQTSASYPLTRNGLTIKASGTDGVEFVMLSSTDTGFNGGCLVRNGADFGIVNRTNGSIIFATNAIERVTIAGSDGKVTMTATESSYGQLKLIGSTGESSIGFRFTGDGDASSWVIGKGAGTGTALFGFYYGATRMTLSTDGQLGIYNRVYASGNVRPSDGGYGGIDFTNTGIGYQYAAKIYTFKSSGEYYGFTNDYGSGTSAQLSIVSKESGGTGNIGFYTGAASVSSERMRVSSGGNLLIGTTTDNGHKLQVNGLIYGTERMLLGTSSSSSQVEINGGSTSYGGGNGHLKVTSGATGQTVLNISNSSVPRSWEFAVGGSASGIGAGVFYIYDNTAGAARMTIATSGAVNFYSSVSTTGGFFESSDKRLKKEISDNPIINRIADVKPKLYIKDGKEELGYYAQELQDILPSAVNEGKDGFLSLAYSQVHTAKIAQLENKIQELEALIKNLIK